MTLSERLARHAHDLDASGHDQYLGPIIVDLTTAQIGTLFSSPIEIIPATGSGTAIVPAFASFAYSGTQGFTNEPNHIGLAIDITNAFAITFGDSAQVTVSGSIISIGKHQNGYLFENQPLMLTADLDPVVVSGTSNGVARVAVWYGIMYLV